MRKYIKEYENKKRDLLNAGEVNKELIEDLVSPPKYDVSNRVRRKLTDEIIERIDYFVKENEVKKATGKSKQMKKKIDGIKENVELKKYGRLRYKYLKENKPYLFSVLLSEGELMKHVIEIEKQAYERFERIKQEYFREHPLPDDGNFVESYRIRQQARDVVEEVVLKELIYN